MIKILAILLGIVVVLHQIPEGASKESYQLSINERGTPFNETIEIDDMENTVLYKVPSHNEIKKTDVLVDYENGHFVTKIFDEEVCYVKVFPTVGLQSIEETRKNLKIIQHLRTQSRNTSIPVEKVTSIMKIIREIPREELSTKVLHFCGNVSMYLVEEKVIPKKKGKSLMKRAVQVQQYRFRILNSQSNQAVARILPNGYLTCKEVKPHNDALFSCLNRGKNPMVGCGLYPVTCRYQAVCKVLAQGKKKIASIGSIGTRDGDFLPKFNYVDIKCVEEHKFTAQWCCDVLPCK